MQLAFFNVQRQVLSMLMVCIKAQLPLMKLYNPLLSNVVHVTQHLITCASIPPIKFGL